MKRSQIAATVVLALAALAAPLGAQAKQTITWFVDGTWYRPVADSDSSLITKYMSEQTGVKVLASNPSEDQGTKLNLMLAANEELPDVITEPDPIRWSRLVQSGAMLDLTPYLSRLTNLKEIIPDQMIKMMREPDGKLYGFPQIFATKISRGDNCLMYNQAYYAASGSPKLDTWEAFEAALVKAKSLKTKDGKPVIPLSFEVSKGAFAADVWLLQIMLASYGVKESCISGNGLMAYDEKSGPYSAISTDAFKKSVLLLNKWYNAGLIDREAFIETHDQFAAKAVSNEVAYTLHSYWGTDIYGMGVDGSKNDQRSKAQNAYWGMRPPIDKSYKGVYKNWDTAASAAWHIGISAKSKNIDAALKWFNYNLSSRAQFIHWFGNDPKGEFTAMDKFLERIPGTVMTRNRPEAINPEITRLGGQKEYDDFYGRFWNNPFLSQDIEAEGNYSGDHAQLDAMTKDWTWDGILITNLDPSAGTPELAIYQKIRTIANAGFAKIVMSPAADAPKALAEMLKSVDAAGMDKLVKVWQAKYEANKAKMK